MQIKNYPQFAKKTFFLGLSRSFVVVYMLGFAFPYILLTVSSTIFKTIPTLAFIADYIKGITILWILLSLFGYLYFAYKFKMNNYWFDRLCLKELIRRKYRFLSKERTIISR